MKTSLFQISILCCILYSSNITAQPIISYTENTQDGFTMTYSLQEEQVIQVFSIYKEIKLKDSEIDLLVFETFRLGMIAFFKKNPKKAAKLLADLRLVAPSSKLLLSMLNKKNDKVARKVKVDAYARQLVGEVISTITAEKIVAKTALNEY